MHDKNLNQVIIKDNIIHWMLIKVISFTITFSINGTKILFIQNYIYFFDFGMKWTFFMRFTHWETEKGGADKDISLPDTIYPSFRFSSSLIITVLRRIIRTQIFRPVFISDSRGRHFTLAVTPAETLPPSYSVVMWSVHESPCYF